MRTLFADMFFWDGLLNKRDQWHARVVAFTQQMGTVRLVTTQEVLVEVLNALSGAGEGTRSAAIKLIENLSSQPNVEVIPQTADTFAAGLARYAVRPDQAYSMTDCISMVCIETFGIWEVLTGDKHFEAAGFQRLFRP